MRGIGVSLWLGTVGGMVLADVTTPSIPPRRIITIAPNSAEIICELGECDRIVGVDKFCVHPPLLSDRPRVGGLFDPDLEKIIALRPDLLILRGLNPAVTNLCQERGIPIHMDRTERLDDIPKCIRELATILGIPARGRELEKEFEDRLAVIRRRVAGRPRPRVFLTVSRQPDRLSDILTTGKGTFLDEMIEVAGGTNIFFDHEISWPQVNPESILIRRPDVILELMPEVKLTEEGKIQSRAQWDRFEGLPAASSRRIYFLTDDHVLIPSLRFVEIIEKVSLILHPDPNNAVNRE